MYFCSGVLSMIPSSSSIPLGASWSPPERENSGADLSVAAAI